MNVDFINPFIETIDNILATMASMTCEHGKAYIKEGVGPLGVVTGVIPMDGDSVHGSLAISFSAGAIVCISSNMLGEEIAEVDETCHDLTGELTNMLSGGARKLLWEKGYNFEMAKPSLIAGDKDIEHSISAPVIVIPFTTKAGPFFIEVAIGSKLRRAASVI
ncbi:chemotaxis protein CheX [Thalassolituus oleivorans]|uniref:chemotaxis protein CheX n=1 Tax=Thalassolituus oleivorans TaxID=187493 RepID=UPI0023F0CFDA|nr:chemotaxis protein CheX [Thalassolituus oleivorans]